ncbi:MAG: sigma-70 family RNA polymerase sigma factor [Actinobacteria bacterium]|nr:sigma-70 family RNA polymerase sigma factor [Actinomycetota bacterium]
MRYGRQVLDRDDAALVAALRARDDATFTQLVREWNASMLRVAQIFVPSRAIAEEVVQETWLRVLNALDRFEGRSSLKTWVFRILVNTAKTRAQREGRVVPFSSLRDPGRVPESAVDPDRFRPEDDERYPGHWSSPPRELPEEQLLAAETQAVVERAIAALPASQASVISLRDVQGWSAEEVCNALDITEVNQRVLLHRARAKVRQALEDYLAPETG